jgi:CheY-like chemotaxis protein
MAACGENAASQGAWVTGGGSSESRPDPQRVGTVLFVDDEEAICEWVVDALEALDFRVATCVDGREALEYYRRNRESVGLVFFDVQMPEMSGAEAFRAMRQIDPEVPAVMVSGFSAEGVVRDCLSEGAKAFLPKPFSLADIVGAIEDYAARPKVGDGHPE